MAKSTYVEAAAVILEKKQSFYIEEKGNEPNQKPPLIYVDGAGSILKGIKE